MEGRKRERGKPQQQWLERGGGHEPAKNYCIEEREEGAQATTTHVLKKLPPPTLPGRREEREYPLCCCPFVLLPLFFAFTRCSCSQGMTDGNAFLADLPYPLSSPLFLVRRLRSGREIDEKGPNETKKEENEEEETDCRKGRNTPEF